MSDMTILASALSTLHMGEDTNNDTFLSCQDEMEVIFVYFRNKSMHYIYFRILILVWLRPTLLKTIRY